MSSERPPGADAAGTARYVGLLTQVMNNTLDEDYRVVADRTAADAAGATGGHGGPGERRSGKAGAGVVGVVAVLALFGLLVGVAALSTRQDQPRLEAEREELIDQIQTRETRLDELQTAIRDIGDEITVLQRTVADEVESSTALQRRLENLGIAAGTVAVRGPGMVITVDDAPGADASSGGVIRDHDLQSLVNGLWTAGAEAVAVDGHRLTALTAIRFAGQAITVDNWSLSPPYVVDVIGNPDTLPADLAETEGGQLWLSLEVNFGIGYDYETSESITVPADPHEHLSYAESAAR